jgi:hypothetical protein
MTDMTAFERQVAGEMLGRAGPVRPVDDLSIYESVAAASRSPRWGFTMFSALKLVAAAVIVALFGGFLLAGILTTQQGAEMAPAAVTESPSPMTTEELLSGMVTEEVEPGVYRVINDGVRDLASVEAADIVAGYDGGIWLLRGEGFLRLGSDGSYGWPLLSGPQDHVFQVAPDGTMWIIPPAPPGYAFTSSDGEEWTHQPCPEGCDGITVAPDGTLWALWREGGRSTVGRLETTGWEPVAGDAPAIEGLRFTDAGDLYALSEGSWGLYSYHDGSWHTVAGVYGLAGSVDVGPDGTVWLRSSDGGYVGETPTPAWEGAGLLRLADGEPRLWSSDELPDLGRPVAAVAGQGLEAAPDGSVWIDTGIIQRDPEACDGLVRFDGVRFDRYLEGRCITMDIDALGSAWVLANDEVYVITPEAVAA